MRSAAHTAIFHALYKVTILSSNWFSPYFCLSQTSDWTAEKSIAMKEFILATGVGKDDTEETIRSAIPEEQRQHVSKVRKFQEEVLLF